MSAFLRSHFVQFVDQSCFQMVVFMSSVVKNGILLFLSFFVTCCINNSTRAIETLNFSEIKNILSLLLCSYFSLLPSLQFESQFENYFIIVLVIHKCPENILFFLTKTYCDTLLMREVSIKQIERMCLRMSEIIIFQSLKTKNIFIGLD